MRLPIRTRLTVIFGALMLIVIAAMGIFIYEGLGSRLNGAIDDGLRSRAQVILGGIGDSGINFADESSLIESEKAFAQVVARNGELLEASADVRRPLLTSSEIRSLRSPRFFETELVVGADDDHHRTFIGRDRQKTQALDARRPRPTTKLCFKEARRT